MKKTIMHLAALFTLCGLLLSCVVVPETGRMALRMLPESYIAGMATAQFDAMKRDLKVSTDPAYTARLERIGRRVTEAAGIDPVEAGSQWEFVVFADDAVNAFAMPGGKVGFYTGLMDLAESDDEIAIVMGHEIAHVTLHHGNERVSQAMAAQAAMLGAQYAARNQEERTQQAILTALGIGAQLGVLLPFSRKHESESDRIGLMYAARAGYDPRAAISFWERMEREAQRGAPPEFLSTHPAHERRIRDLNAILPEALREYEQALARQQ